MKRLTLAAILAAAAAIPPAVHATPPKIGTCDVFPASNFWNTPVDTLALHPSSLAWTSNMGLAKALHPDFGSFLDAPTNQEPFGIPYTTVPGNQPRVPMAFDVPEESDPGPYPFPPNAPVEGTVNQDPNVGGDRHVLVVDRDNCVLYETDASYPLNGGASWTAFSGARFDFTLNAMRPDTWTSADAAGLPILPGLVRYDEATAGDIRHALRFTANSTLNQHIWPATHDASSLAGAQYPPLGARFRLKAAVVESNFSGPALAVVKALKKYGMVLADNGSDWYISGEHNPAWNDAAINQMKSLHGSDFEVVDTAPMMISPTSTKAFQPPPAIAFREIASGLTMPTDIEVPHDGSNRLFITEQVGTIRVFKNGALLPVPFIDLSARMQVGGEQGLLGLAFDPLYKFNRRFFVYYNSPGGDIHVSMFLANNGSPDTADPTSESVLLTIPHSQFTNHNGGKLLFGRDGLLYIGVGDGGGGGDPNGNGQNLTVLLAKILRIDVRGASGYAIPPSNPFAGATDGKRREIWAYGVRNPWRFSFDRLNGDFYLGDVGQNLHEEVDYVPAGSNGPLNFGWNVFEGLNCFLATPCSLPNYTPPILAYDHDANGGQAVTGGYVYRGARSAALRGYYLFADYVANKVWAATRDANSWSMFPVRTLGNVLNVSAFGEDEAGELYVASYGNGRVFAIDGAGPAAPPDPLPTPGLPTRFDFNADGFADIVWQNTDGSTALWLMTGATQTGGTRLLGPGTWSVKHVADFNGDGKADILWEKTDGSTAIWLMNGSTQIGGALLLGAGTGWSVALVADFDGDGKADLLWQHTDGRTALWTMNGATQTGGRGLFGAGTGWVPKLVADFNGDGKADILWQHTDGRTAMWLMNGSTQIGGALLFGAGTGWLAKGAGDFNGDGKSDILWEHADGRTAMWLMNGTAQVGGALLLAAGTGWHAVGTGDFNADGKADIVWQKADSVAAWLMNGATLMAGVPLAPLGSGYTFKRIADFNGDGKADVLMQHVSGSTRLWLVDGVTSSATDVLPGGLGWSAVSPPAPYP